MARVSRYLESLGIWNVNKYQENDSGIPEYSKYIWTYCTIILYHGSYHVAVQVDAAGSQPVLHCGSGIWLWSQLPWQVPSRTYQTKERRKEVNIDTQWYTYHDSRMQAISDFSETDDSLWVMTLFKIDFFTCFHPSLMLIESDWLWHQSPPVELSRSQSLHQPSWAKPPRS